MGTIRMGADSGIDSTQGQAVVDAGTRVYGRRCEYPAGDGHSEPHMYNPVCRGEGGGEDPQSLEQCEVE